MGHWGAQEILGPYARFPRLGRRGHVRIQVGEPVDLSDLLEREHTPEVIQEATDRIMAALVALVEGLRQAGAPAERFDPKARGVTQIGNPRARRSRRQWTSRKKDGAR